MVIRSLDQRCLCMRGRNFLLQYFLRFDTQAQLTNVYGKSNTICIYGGFFFSSNQCAFHWMVITLDRCSMSSWCHFATVICASSINLLNIEHCAAVALRDTISKSKNTNKCKYKIIYLCIANIVHVICTTLMWFFKRVVQVSISRYTQWSFEWRQQIAVKTIRCNLVHFICYFLSWTNDEPSANK